MGSAVKITYDGHTDCNLPSLVADEKNDFESSFWRNFNLRRHPTDGNDYDKRETQIAWRVWLVARSFSFKD